MKVGRVMSDEEIKLATEAYLYGYPMDYSVNEMIQTASGQDLIWSAPVNMFGHTCKLADESPYVDPDTELWNNAVTNVARVTRF
jgi:hypothetical protein